MSKVQGKDANLLNNLTGTGIANELDSRLRDLEKNIAVAREFIKLADESYSELRHKWNLLQEEARGIDEASATEKIATPTTKRAVRSPKKESAILTKKAEPSTEEIGIKDFEEFTKSSPQSRNRNKSEKSSKVPKDSHEALSSPSELNTKQSRIHQGKTGKAARKN